jgi:hypothetical protein
MKTNILVPGIIILATGGIAYYVYKKNKTQVGGSAGMANNTAAQVANPSGMPAGAPPALSGFTGTAAMQGSLQDTSTGPNGFSGTVGQTASAGTVTNGGFSGTAAKTVPAPILRPGLPVYSFPLSGGGVLKTNIAQTGTAVEARSGAGHF